MPERTTITPTPQQLRAMTHPVRLRMLGLLRTEGPATATSLAARLGLNSGATSYHLRQLAQHGFIVDDETRGTGRERWWRAAHTYTSTSAPDPADPDFAEASESHEAYLQAVVTVYAEQMQRAVEERALLPAEWREASTFSDWFVRVSPDRARAIVEAIAEILESVDDEPGQPEFRVQLAAFPQSGSLAIDPEQP